MSRESVTHLTGRDNYFDDFAVGERFRHSRGKTITDIEVTFLATLAMNTAQGHFNDHFMADTPFGRRLVFGGVTAAIVIGIATQDTGENADAELGLDNMRFPAPVFVGDTLYAETEVLAVAAPDDATGIVTFKHTGSTSDGTIVFEGERRVLLRRRP